MIELTYGLAKVYNHPEVTWQDRREFIIECGFYAPGLLVQRGIITKNYEIVLN